MARWYVARSLSQLGQYTIEIGHETEADTINPDAVSILWYPDGLWEALGDAKIRRAVFEAPICLTDKAQEAIRRMPKHYRDKAQAMFDTWKDG